ncbi:hypothetical protein CYMTET_41350 [Cymbomonas tetramitiformis]|uniref:RNA-directed DNA polymerase n=1 Tax=Cymbomonas tetramitiformis TaxID=36881 RepID=A0AAE0C6B3_9CHLO|nr:hypothetical protein CYMTET_41350 [Cymbomonas tetramitiformis]
MEGGWYFGPAREPPLEPARTPSRLSRLKAGRQVPLHHPVRAAICAHLLRDGQVVWDTEGQLAAVRDKEGTLLLVFWALLKGQRVRVLVDSGASDEFISTECVKRLGITVRSNGSPLNVTLADGSVQTSAQAAYGKLTAETSVGTYSEVIKMRVLPLGIKVDIVLGGRWLRGLSPVTLDYAGWGTVGFQHKGASVKIAGCSPGRSASRKEAGTAMCLEPIVMLSAAQAVREIKAYRRRHGYRKEGEPGPPRDILIAYATPLVGSSMLSAVAESGEEPDPEVTTAERQKFEKLTGNFEERVIREALPNFDQIRKTETIKDKYPLPDIQQLFDEMHGVRYFSSFDAVDRFWQMTMAPEDVEKTAFTSPYGQYEWLGATQKWAFEEIKAALCASPILALPDMKAAADGIHPFVVQTDASGVALGGVLMQDVGEGLKPIAFESRQFSGAEQNYHAGERELCALHHCTTQTWRHYLIFTEFQLQGDHTPLVWLMSPGQPLSRRQARWYMDLVEVGVPEMEYIPGALLWVPDALSRRPDYKDISARDGLLEAGFVDPKTGLPSRPNANRAPAGGRPPFRPAAGKESRQGRTPLGVVDPNRIKSRKIPDSQGKPEATAALSVQGALRWMDTPDLWLDALHTLNTLDTLAVPTHHQSPGDTKLEAEPTPVGEPSDRQDWKLRADMFDYLNQEYGPFDVDACCDLGGQNRQVNRFWSDCLKEEWRGLNVWCNPPFSSSHITIEAVLRKYVEEWRKDPEHTSALFILPDFQSRIPQWRQLFRSAGMRIEFIIPTHDSYGEAVQIFESPDGTRLNLPWPILVVYAPAAHQRVKRERKTSPAPEIIRKGEAARLRDLSTEVSSGQFLKALRAECLRPGPLKELKDEISNVPHQRTRDFCITGNVLWRICAGRYQLVLGEDSPLREIVLQDAHASVSSGHAGRDKTLERVLRRFWWKRATEDVGRWVASCNTCQSVRPRNCYPDGLLNPHTIPTRLWQVVSVDFVTGLPVTARNHDAFATFTCKLSKMLDLFLQAAKGDSPQRKGGEGSAHEMASRFSGQLADARVKLELAQQRQRTQFDQRHSQQIFQVGDRVWVEAKHLTENIMDRESYRKLSPRWHGPLVVIEQFFSDQQRDLPELDRGAPVAYRLKLPPKWRIHDVFAQHRLKACTTAEEAFARRREVPTPAKVMMDGQAQTHVDRILARRVRTTKAGKKIEEFQVRWTGYSKARDEWKTRADLNFGGPLEQLLVFENERFTQEGRAKEKALHDARSQRLARRQQRAALNAMEVDESNPDYLLRKVVDRTLAPWTSPVPSPVPSDDEKANGKEYKWLLHVKGHHSRFSFLYALQKKEARGVLEALFHIYGVFGPPTIFQTDNGREFTAESLTSALNERWPALQILNGRARHPQSQGSVERANAVVEEYVRLLMRDQPDLPWADPNALNAIAWAMNTTFCQPIQMTPYKCLFGYAPRLEESDAAICLKAAEISMESTRAEGVETEVEEPTVVEPQPAAIGALALTAEEKNAAGGSASTEECLRALGIWISRASLEACLGGALCP